MSSNPLTEPLPTRLNWHDVRSAPIYTALTMALHIDPLGVGLLLPNEVKRQTTRPTTARKRPPRKVTAKQSPKPLDNGDGRASNSR